MITERVAEAFRRAGSVRGAARELRVHPSTVSRSLKRAGIPTIATQTRRATLQRKIKWIDLLSQRELAALKLLDGKGNDASYRDVGIVLGILDDKRYREEHPESVRGNVVNIDNRQITITDQVLEALRAARPEGGQDA